MGAKSGRKDTEVREELQREKLSIRAGRKAWDFENRLRKRKGSEVARECWR